jgi:hypothetical protein
MAAVRGADGRYIKGSGAPGWTPTGTVAGPISITLDTRALNAFKKRVERYQGKPLRYRMDRGTYEAGKLLVPSVRKAAPKGPTGNLKRSVSVFRSRGGPSVKRMASGLASGALSASFQGGLTQVYVGPGSRIAPHRHLVIQGHRIVTPGGRDTGKRATGNPFVDEATRPRAAEAMRVVSRAIFGGG